MSNIPIITKAQFDALLHGGFMSVAFSNPWPNGVKSWIERRMMLMNPRLKPVIAAFDDDRAWEPCVQLCCVTTAPGLLEVGVPRTYLQRMGCLDPEPGGPVHPSAEPSDFSMFTLENLKAFLRSRGWTEVPPTCCWQKPGVNFIAAPGEAFLLEL